MKFRRRIGKEWLLFFVFLLTGICLMQVAATMATRVNPYWNVQAEVASHLDPDSAYRQVPAWTVEAIRPEILTPPPWNPDDLLTPQFDEPDSITVVPPMAFKPTATPTRLSQDNTPAPARDIQASATPRFTETKASAETATLTKSASPTIKTSVTLTSTVGKTSTVIITPTRTPTSGAPTATLKPGEPSATPMPTKPIQATHTPKPTSTSGSQPTQPPQATNTSVPQPTQPPPPTNTSAPPPTQPPPPTNTPVPPPTKKPSHTPKPTHTPKPKD